MNKKLSAIFARRSVREYLEKEVPDDLVADLLQAGMAAPSAVCKDPWHFVVVRRRKGLDAIADGLPHGQMLKGAPLAIVVCGDPARAHDGQESYLLQDCSAAIENILIAASATGLGTCWLGVHPRTERIAHLRNVLQIPSTIVPISVISIGWPACDVTPRTRYSDAAVHREKW